MFVYYVLYSKAFVSFKKQVKLLISKIVLIQYLELAN
jgi:hypothetical protein